MTDVRIKLAAIFEDGTCRGTMPSRKDVYHIFWFVCLFTLYTLVSMKITAGIHPPVWYSNLRLAHGLCFRCPTCSPPQLFMGLAAVGVSVTSPHWSRMKYTHKVHQIIEIKLYNARLASRLIAGKADITTGKAELFVYSRILPSVWRLCIALSGVCAPGCFESVC